MNKLKKNKKLQEIALSAIKAKNKMLYKSKALSNYNAKNTTITQQEVIDYNESRLFGYQPYICNAPFNSLYFENRGRVMACCMSGNYVLGDVSQQSLKEIWEGEQAQTLRTDIKQYNLKKACLKCEHAIKAGAFDSAMSSEYDSISATKTLAYPQRLDFELHNTCNLACVMCNSRNSSSYAKKFHPNEAPMPMKYGDKFLKELRAFIPHLKKANFLGGEPFLIDVYYEIWDMILELNPSCNVFIQTNGHILNNKIKKMLSKGNFSIGISFESLDRDRFNKIRLNGNYDKLMENIEFYKSYCKEQETHLSFAITPLRKTVHELNDFVEFANKHVASVFFNVATEPHDMAIWSMKPEEIQNILDQLNSDILAVPNTALEHSNLKQLVSFKKQMGNWKDEATEREKSIAKINDKSNDGLIEVILENMKPLLQNELEYNKLYKAEYISEMEEIKHTLSLMNNDQYRGKLLFLAAVDPERSSSELAKKPLNKMAFM